jgi:predicted nucleotidyltransferase
MKIQIDIENIKVVAKALAELNTKVVFVGGSVASLYADKPIYDFRATEDIDVIFEIISYAERADLEERLRNAGFVPDSESGVICRYKFKGITVDVMPTDDPSIGFKNIWYPDGFKYATAHQLDAETSINILSPPHFIATKLEAYKGRGGGDGRMSHDFEDIVFIFENRDAIWNEIGNTENKLKDYLKDEFSVLISKEDFFDWIDGHVVRASPPATYFIIENLKLFLNNT